MLMLQSLGFVAAGDGGNDAFTKVLLHMDGSNGATTFTDVAAGATPHTFTAAGNAQISTAQSKFGGASGLFDGSGDTISTPANADMNLGSGDWTIDCWVRRASTGAYHYICSRVNGGSPYDGWYLGISNSDKVIFNTDSNVTRITSSSSIPANAWTHIALVRSGTTITLYIDGVADGTWTGNAQAHSSYALVIGSASFGGVDFNGHIDEFRLSVGIARWTANFTPPAQAYG